MLYLCGNQSLLKAVNRWIGEGGKATLVGAPDPDILAAAIKILRKRIAAGTVTILVKVKAHRAEPANEGADYFRSESRHRVVPNANGRIEQFSRGETRAARQEK